MNRRAFSLLELLAAVLIGSMIMLMIAGSLRTAIKSWESVQKKVSVNYNRRNALDLVKRQTSSLFFKREADALSMQGRASVRDRALEIRRRQANLTDDNGQAISDALGNQDDGMEGGVEFALPDGAHYLQGNIQELNFVSTISFLSDFPGQVAVRYYVVQGQPEEGETIADLTSTRTDDEIVDDGELMVADALSGGLYFVMEERNLFLAAAMDEGFGDEMNAFDGGMNAESFDFGTQTGPGTAGATATMKLLGPLRDMTIRYRVPSNTNLEDWDTEENWAEVWDVEEEGKYPTAIEFTFFYEEPGVTDHLPLEELDGIRMVIPVYDASNMNRGGNNVPF